MLEWTAEAAPLAIADWERTVLRSEPPTSCAFALIRSTSTRTRARRPSLRLSAQQRAPHSNAASAALPRRLSALRSAKTPSLRFRFPTISPRNSIPPRRRRLRKDRDRRVFQPGCSIATSWTRVRPSGAHSQTVHGVCSRLAVTPIVAPCPRHNARRGPVSPGARSPGYARQVPPPP